MAKVIIGMIPPGGWHYYDSDVKLTSHSYESLLKSVENYRAENNLPLGDVEGDVNSYICSNWPNFCHGVDMVVVTSVHPESAQQSLLNDITTWARNLLNSKTANNLSLISRASSFNFPEPLLYIFWIEIAITN
jgi:hypothetical protein